MKVCALFAVLASFYKTCCIFNPSFFEQKYGHSFHWSFYLAVVEVYAVHRLLTRPFLVGSVCNSKLSLNPQVLANTSSNLRESLL